MTPPFVDSALALRLELCTAWRKAHYAEAYSLLHPGVGSCHAAVGGGMAVFIAPHSPVNGAVGLGLNREVTSQDFDVLEEFFISRGAVPEVYACPLADPSLFDHINRRGYQVSHFFSVLVRELPEGLEPGPQPAGISVTRTRPEDAEIWLFVSARGFEGSDQIPPETYEILGPNFYAPQSTCYLAWIDGEPAAAGGMYPHGGVVELGGASTRLAYRRRGAQRALIETRINDARAQGCDLALILTEPGSDSQRNAQRAGFWLAYTSTIFRQNK